MVDASQCGTYWHKSHFDNWHRRCYAMRCAAIFSSAKQTMWRSFFILARSHTTLVPFRERQKSLVNDERPPSHAHASTQRMRRKLTKLFFCVHRPDQSQSSCLSTFPQRIQRVHVIHKSSCSFVTRSIYSMKRESFFFFSPYKRRRFSWEKNIALNKHQRVETREHAMAISSIVSFFVEVALNIPDCVIP